MKSLRLLLSFDHELSLGGTSSFERNLFEPTEEILSLANELDVPITLFTDICCANRYREWDHQGFFRPFRAQIQRAVREGHDVQLHIHPHWIDTTYENGTFFPAKTYSLGDFRDRLPPNDIHGIVRQSIEALHELCSVSPDYQCIAFRAGGFCLTPNTAEILDALYRQGIRIDSSIAKGYRYRSDLWSVDHRAMPDEANWYIPHLGPLNVSATEGLYEIPIATRPRNMINNLPFLLKRTVDCLSTKRASHASGRPIDDGSTSTRDRIARLFPRSAWMLGFDNFADTVNDLMKTLRYHIDKHASDSTIACSVISHPKMMDARSRRLMRDFVNRVRSDYGDVAEFCSYQGFFHDYLANDGLRARAGVPDTGAIT